MNKLIVKDYQDSYRGTANSSIHHPHRSSFPPAYSQLKHSLVPLENSRFGSSFFLPSHPCMGWTEQHYLQKQPQSRSGESQTTLKGGQEKKMCYCTILPCHSMGLTGMQPQPRRFTHVQKASEYSTIRYQKC